MSQQKNEKPITKAKKGQAKVEEVKKEESISEEENSEEESKQEAQLFDKKRSLQPQLQLPQKFIKKLLFSSEGKSMFSSAAYSGRGPQTADKACQTEEELLNTLLLEKLRNAYMKNLEQTKVKEGKTKGVKISSTKNKFD